MSPKSPASPTHSTSIRSAPRLASSSTAADTSTSRVIVTTPNHSGTAPFTITETTAVPTRIRSAVGSSTLPTVETWCHRRATKPSTQSVAPSTARRIAAAICRCSPNKSHTNTGTHASRTIVMAFGTVSMRSAPACSTPMAPAGAITPASLRGMPTKPWGDTGRARCTSSARALVCYARPMPRFRPFTGLRYDSSVPLVQVIAPPYDVVGPDERAELAARHRANSIRVELPVEDVRAGLDKYQSAARLFAEWREEGLLVRDHRAAFYAYRMTVPGGGSTTGVIGALACEAPGGDILPHEQTIPKDKSDRLDLLRACHATLSPIWGLSLARGLAGAYEPEGSPHAQAVDDDGITHSLWVLDAP